MEEKVNLSTLLTKHFTYSLPSRRIVTQSSLIMSTHLNEKYSKENFIHLSCKRMNMKEKRLNELKLMNFFISKNFIKKFMQ